MDTKETGMINLRVLQCKHLVWSDLQKIKNMRIVKDYEIDFYINVSRVMYIDDVEYHISNGDIVFRKPGQTVYSFGDYNCYMLTLDFSGKVKVKPNTYIRHRLSEMQEECSNPILNIIPSVFKPLHETDYIKLFEKLCTISHPYPIDEYQQQAIVTELIYLAAADAIQQSCQSSQIITLKLMLHVNISSQTTTQEFHLIFYQNMYI